MRRARDEQGFVLISAIILLMVIMGLGLGLLMFGDSQQRAAGGEQARETAFDLAEAALNAQVEQLGRVWPAREAQALPSRCTAAESTATNGCPTAASLASAYPNTGSQTCTGTEPWGSPLSNTWTTYVRNDVEGSSVFNSTAEQTAASWDSTANNKLWVRAVGVVQCHVVTLVTLVSRQLVAVSFPRAAATGNWFRVTNSGKKVIVNTAGEPPVSQPGEISMRCSDLGSQPCEEWSEAKEQISPNTTKSPPAPSPLLSESTMEELRSTAQAAGTLYSAAQGNCPTSAAAASGDPAYVEGCGEMKWTGNGVGNSSASPGFLILADGNLELAGTSEFYGVIYARNPTNSSGAVVSLGGKAQVYGAIDVDGNGGIEFGSSKANLIYDPRATFNLKASVGVAPTGNTFRILPVNQ
jgi:Tfp pilus assembly protein PilX